MPAVTMKEIAEKLNISTVSVSKALNNKEGVGVDLRKKIIETAEEMGYKTKKASQLSSKRRLIGVVISKHFLNPSPSFYWSLYEQVYHSLKERNYQCLLEIVDFEEEQAPAFLDRNDLDGIIVVGFVETENMKIIDASGLPIVMVDFCNERIRGIGIIPDNCNSTYRMTSYLIDSGHKKIGYVGNIKAMPNIMDRFLGYYRALLLNDIEFNKDWIISDRDDNATLYDTFSLPEDMPTAFVCHNDQTAYRFVQYLTEQGYRVPEDISVTGFYDYAYAVLSRPQLTTVHVEMAEMAEIAVDVLYKRIELHTNPTNTIHVHGHIKERKSVMKR